MADIATGMTLWGVWRLGRLLGSGTFGDVYEAKRFELGREYSAAVKHIAIPPKGVTIQALREDGLVTDELSARSYCDDLLNALTREIDLCYELKGYTNFVNYEDHVIVPRVSEIGYDIFIRMELLTSLTDHISANGISVAGISKLCEDMCSALEVLEQKNLVHRDIKPANIFVNATGDFKLGDFGVARHMEGLGSMSVKGTYNYMSPEVLQGGKVGPNSDIYSLGLVLYRLLNYNRAPLLPPPPAKVSYQENQSVLDRRLSGEPLPPPARAELSLPLTNVIMRACEYSPERRFQSAREMKQALRDFQNADMQRQSFSSPGFDPDATVALERSAHFHTPPSQFSSQPAPPPVGAAYRPAENAFSQQGAPGQGMQPPQQPSYQPQFQSGSLRPPVGSPKRKGISPAIIAVSALAVVLVVVLVIFLLPKGEDHLGNASAPPQQSQTLPSAPVSTPKPAVSPSPSPSPTPSPSPSPTPTPTPTPPPPWSDFTLSASASSTLPTQYGYTYDAGNVLNDSTSSPWVEGASGYGLGEWIQIAISTGETALLSEISIRNGHQRTNELFYKNGRVQDITLEFSDGSSLSAVLDDHTNWQTIVLSTPVETSYVRIIIDSVYSATHYTDTCITAISCR